MNNLISKFSEDWRVAFTALFANKFRAILTTIGIGIGIAAVVILVSLGQAVQGYVDNQFTSVGTDIIYIRPVFSFRNAGQAGRSGATLSSLTDKDVTAMSDAFNVPNVKTIVPVAEARGTVTNGPNTARQQVMGTTPAYFDMFNRQIASGQLFTQQDITSASRVVVIGQTVITNLFPGQDPIGASVNVNGVLFRVIGTLQAAGSGAGGGGMQDQDNIMLAPITAVEQHLVTERTVTGAIPLDQVYVQASSTDAVDGIVTNLTQVLRVDHSIKPGTTDDFTVTAQLDVLNNFNSLISTLTVFLGIIGGVSLVVGGIGVMNIMLVTVTERTREIGLRKAVGARASDVLMQFLTESLVLCFVGAASGLALAVGVTVAVRSLVPNLYTVVSLPSVELAAGVTTLIGVFFGLYPSSRAAALNPIQALRTE